MKIYWIGVFAVLVCLMLLRVRTSPSEELPAQHASSSPTAFPLVKTSETPVQDKEDDTNNLLNLIRRNLASDKASDRDLAFTNLLPILVEKDPWTAAHFAESLEPQSLREDFIRHLIELWAAKDPKAAESWAAQLSEEDERNLALSAVCSQRAEVDAHEALLIAQNHDLGKMPGDIMQDLVQQWAQQDFPGAMAWINGQPAGAQRNDMMMRIALVESQSAPEDAARLVVDQIPAGSTQTEAAMMVVHQWAKQDFNGASAWVQQFPEGPLRDRAEAELVGISKYSQ